MTETDPVNDGLKVADTVQDVAPRAKEQVDEPVLQQLSFAPHPEPVELVALHPIVTDCAPSGMFLAHARLLLPTSLVVAVHDMTELTVGK